jgi:Rrf2 family cysteine metabolism transcriptional repressor
MSADYAARAVLDLAQRYGMGPVRGPDIARRQHIAESFLEQLLTALRKAGVVHSVRGSSGGHVLARPPASLTLKDVVEAVEGRIAGPPACMPDGFCIATPDCVLQDVWRDLADAHDRLLGSITFEQLVQRKYQAEAGASYHI